MSFIHHIHYIIIKDLVPKLSLRYIEEIVINFGLGQQEGLNIEIIICNVKLEGNGITLFICETIMFLLSTTMRTIELCGEPIVINFGLGQQEGINIEIIICNIKPQPQGNAITLFICENILLLLCMTMRTIEFCGEFHSFVAFKIPSNGNHLEPVNWTIYNHENNDPMMHLEYSRFVRFNQVNSEKSH